jgi:hypothetical protein
MRRTFACAGLAALLVVCVSGSGFAGGQPLSCYEQAVVPAVYQTVQERVLVQKASRYTVTEPAIYSTQAKRVVLQPERVSYRTIAPIYSVRNRTVMVRPASYGWEYQMRKGRKVLCKVKHPAVYSTVQERVLVKPGGRVAVRTPAIYGTVNQRVLVRRASSRVMTRPAVYKTVTRTVKVRDAQTVWKPVPVNCRK